MAEQESKKRKMGESDADKSKRLQAGPRHLKMLVHNHVAGTIIGTGGVVLAELESTTGACIRLSRPGVTFPGTSERLLVAGGSLDAVHQLLRKVVEKQLAAAAEQGTEPNTGMNTLRLILPNSSVSSVIGRGGEVVREIQQETGARVSVGDRVPGFQERICIIKGTVEQMISAGNSVMDKIKDDDNVSSVEFLDVFNVGGSGNSGGDSGPPNHQQGGPPPNHQHNHAHQQQMEQMAMQNQMAQNQIAAAQAQQQAAQAAAAAAAAQAYPPAPHRAIYATVPPEIFEKNATICVEVADAYVAGVYGKDRSLIREMGAKTSCRMEFIDENVPGKMQRTLEISGPLQNVHVAHVLVLKRLNELELQYYPPHGAPGMAMDPGYGMAPGMGAPPMGHQFPAGPGGHMPPPY